MLNTDLMSGVSLETLGAMLLSSLFLAEYALADRSLARPDAVAPRMAVAPLRNRREDPLFQQSFAAGAASVLRRAERLRGRGLSRCLSRARVRRVIRIRGRR